MKISGKYLKGNLHTLIRELVHTSSKVVFLFWAVVGRSGCPRGGGDCVLPRICLKMVGRWADNFLFQMQTPQQRPQLTTTRGHGINLLHCCSRIRLKSKKSPHPPNQIFVFGMSCGIIIFSHQLPLMVGCCLSPSTIPIGIVQDWVAHNVKPITIS